MPSNKLYDLQKLLKVRRNHKAGFKREFLSLIGVLSQVVKAGCSFFKEVNRLLHHGGTTGPLCETECVSQSRYRVVVPFVLSVEC